MKKKSKDKKQPKNKEGLGGLCSQTFSDGSQIIVNGNSVMLIGPTKDYQYSKKEPTEN